MSCVAHYIQVSVCPSMQLLKLLCMLQAVIRAMDTVATFAKEKTSANITKFAIAGASKVYIGTYG